MSRLSTLNPADMSDEQRGVYEAIISGPRGRIVGPLGVWLHNPKLADPAQRLGAYCRFGSSLPKRLSEQAIITVGAFWLARFEWFAHAPMALEAGVSAAVIDAIKHGREPAITEDDERQVYRFTSELITTRNVSQATFDEAVRVLGRNGVIDLVGISGYYTLVSMTLNVFEVPLPDGTDDPFPE
jgi:4-carboxymuconolactone decarboxylase